MSVLRSLVSPGLRQPLPLSCREDQNSDHPASSLGSFSFRDLREERRRLKANRPSVDRNTWFLVVGILWKVVDPLGDGASEEEDVGLGVYS